ncbi:MAG: sulfatase-like hydrolase/transferase [Candidatus ainarchaeum sp.]|nr:sulfatase-like hydrolase/transferase [Candidatus ainarchaeum sp.]
MKNILLITVDCLRYDHSRVIIDKINEVLGEGIEFENAYATGNFTGSSFPGILCSKFIDMPGEDMCYKLVPSINNEIVAQDQCFSIKNSRKRVYITEIIKNGYKSYAMTNNPYVETPEYMNTIDEIKSKYSKKKTINNRMDGIIKKISFKFPILYHMLRKEIRPFYRFIKDIFISKNINTPFLDAEKNSYIIKEIIDGSDQKKFIHAHYMDLHFPYYKNEYLELEIGESNILLVNSMYGDKQLKVDEKKEIIYKKAYKIQTEYVAEQVSKSLNEIKDKLDNSLIILTADHGELLGENNGGRGHGRMRNKKELELTLCEELLHVPLVIWGLGKGKVNKVVSLVDLSPTILDIIGMEKPSEWYGETLFSKTERPAISELRSNLGNFYTIRTQKWTLRYNEKENKKQLYTRGKEDKDLSNEKPEVVKEMMKLFEEHKKKKERQWKEMLKKEINEIKNKK